MISRPKNYEAVLIAAATPSFVKEGALGLSDNIKKYKALRLQNNFWRRNTLIIEAGEKTKPSELTRALSDLGYARHQQITSANVHKGEFFPTGGAVIVFPINHSSPLAVEFLGNSISSIEEREVIAHEKIFSGKAGQKFEPGDYLVHEDHGIGIFRGIEENKAGKYFSIEYAQARRGGDPDRLLVPEKFAKKISPYLGLRNPPINRLGTPFWNETRRKAKENIVQFARELLELYKTRAGTKRPPYEENELEKEIWQNFEYELTKSQASALSEIFVDLKKDEPMERLLVGDVGFGKTEVALRAILRAALSGRQSAVLSPTTVLTDQHFETFHARFENFGLKIARLSRLEKKNKIGEILKELKEGKTDVLIGTHRLLTKDVEFKNLGLLVIDEEQRFGVKQKEAIKKRYPKVDILYLSATPIPRTLAFSISKIRPMSLIEDPPEGRIPITTFVMPKSDKIIKEAIDCEIKRGGQVYFLASRIHKIPFIIKKLDELLPEVKKAVLHGRMDEKKLIETMRLFRKAEIPILVSTTIIENGLDISSANTLIVEDSARLGLSQSHQLRGRIGRGRVQAHAYFLYSEKNLSALAQKRLETLMSFQELGSGFEIAKKDLEIRGAGNVLGSAQSGVINKIGWNLYFQYLSESIEKLY